MGITQLDFLWYRVQHNPDRLEEAVKEVLHLFDITPSGARELLTNTVKPSDRRPREAKDAQHNQSIPGP